MATKKSAGKTGRKGGTGSSGGTGGAGGTGGSGEQRTLEMRVAELEDRISKMTAAAGSSYLSCMSCFCIGGCSCASSGGPCLPACTTAGSGATSAVQQEEGAGEESKAVGSAGTATPQQPITAQCVQACILQQCVRPVIQQCLIWHCVVRCVIQQCINECGGGCLPGSGGGGPSFGGLGF